MGQKVKATRVHTCNVLQPGAEKLRLWQFGFSGSEVRPGAEQEVPADKPLPQELAGKGWRCLWQPKVNVAWLPIEQVFLRVIQLPTTEFSEALAMVELQLEKLSPLPVNQIVWSAETVPSPDAGNQTVIVLIAARNAVEEFLGRLETQGYLADRLELPALRQLQARPFEGDGLWLNPITEGANEYCLAAWWQKGQLRNLNLLRISGGPEWKKVFFDALTQIAWAGEMEGWGRGIHRIVLTGGPETVSVWEPALAEAAGSSIEVRAPLSAPELAAANARCLAGSELSASLVPPEFAIRYRQQFVDRLWMRGLGAIVALYVLGVILYLLGAQVIHFQTYRVETKVAALSGQYTNTMQLKARLQVLQDQVNLKYAALECWKAAATLLPQDLTLTDLSLQQGKTLTIHGTAPADQVDQIIEYNQAMSHYRMDGTNGALLFNKVQPYNTTSRSGVGAQQSWDFACEINRKDIE
jgi:hypothetical protein